MEQIKFRLTGIRPLLQHNERLANPLNPITKELKAVSGKRQKSDEDHAVMAQIEFRGGLYINDDGPYIPGISVESCLLESSRKEKLGQIFKSYVQCFEDQIRLDYDGPRTLEKLWKAGFCDQRMVKIQKSKTLRTRPQFPIGWMIEPTFLFDQAHVDKAQMIRCMERAGESLGLGDFRPRFGRFKVEVIK